MKYTETPIEGAVIIELEKHEDARGFFARGFCKKEFEEHGLEHEIVQCNFSKSVKKGTLRGMHYQSPPHAEVKMVRCLNGAIYDVIVDIRKDSPTYKQWFGVKLTDKDYKMLYIPKGLAHGFQTLEENSVIFYMVTENYNQQSERGVRWNDPAFDIDWPLSVTEISEKDQAFTDYYE
ncbi:dTDP-4-dehydrorhamnose 3,5-epimerase [Rhodohalobacter sp. SW132]|uniref:dTDP-4-dehydrorhamnose 3,5-epimerase n=1 Tax=Rhodohalobacter sp. SW132 TaxID=2293433 RepID=UPI000E234592|nr:dTDP-4-dehydrorhamnose 3,5-epimerase [Rhodohalobacter sp. SW132]REL24182.1 dTDP-4-dehydrorhamnose 3,5-epimerase [Rhodohalobacter sp. SW132]